MRPTPWLLRARPVDAPRVRLLCLPHAGGGASLFAAWAHELAPELDVCGVQLPGRETRIVEPPATRIDPLVEALADAVAPALTVPYAIFGHSMGATIGFELARALRRRGLPAPRHLFVAGRRAPHLPPPQPWRHTLPDAAFVAELRRLGGTPEAVFGDRELFELFAGLLRADFAALETHVHAPAPPLDCPLTVLRGDADAEVSADESAAWARHAAAGARVVVFPGGHFFPHQQRGAVLQELRAALADVPAAPVAP